MGVDLRIILAEGFSLVLFFVNVLGYLVPITDFERIVDEIREKLQELKEKEKTEKEKDNQTDNNKPGSSSVFSSDVETKETGNQVHPVEQSGLVGVTHVKKRKREEEKEQDNDKNQDKWFYSDSDAEDENIEEFLETTKVGILAQNTYGPTKGTEQVLIYWRKGLFVCFFDSEIGCETIMNHKVGGTPFSLLTHKHYGAADDILGGANTDFAVATDFDESELKFKKKIDKYLADENQTPCLFMQALGKTLKKKFSKRYRKWLMNCYE